MKAKVGSRGQITIDAAARKTLGVDPGMVAVQIVVDDHLEVYFLPAPHRRSLFGAVPPKEPVVEDWEEIEQRAARSIAADV